MIEGKTVLAKRLHENLVVVDAHSDVLMQLINGERKLGEHSRMGHVDLPRLKMGGVKLQFFAVFIESEFKPERAMKRALQLIDLFYRELEDNRQDLTLVTNCFELKQVLEEGKVGALLTLEGGEALGEDLAVLRLLYRLGVRGLGLTWNQRNALGDGVGEKITGGGLTNFGREVVREMNRLGMLVDVSHLAESGFWNVLEISTKPVIASHSNCAALCSHRRNLSDEQIIALAKQDGVIGVTFEPSFVHPEHATMEGVLDHIVHIAELVGVKHVSIGSDFDGIDTTPIGLEDVSKMPGITLGLLTRGFSEQDIGMIMGKNLLRILEKVL